MKTTLLGFYIIFSLVIFISSFKLGREWEKVDQQEQKAREPIRQMPNVKNKW